MEAETEIENKNSDSEGSKQKREDDDDGIDGREENLKKIKLNYGDIFPRGGGRLRGG